MKFGTELRSYDITSIEDLEHTSLQIIEKIQSPILLLKGNLGAGKTTFVQHFVKNLGSTDQVSSPTYSIINEYQTPKGTLYHLDLYRLNSEEELWQIGVQDYLYSGNYILIEWPELLLPFLEDDYALLEFQITNNERFIKLSI